MTLEKLFEMLRTDQDIWIERIGSQNQPPKHIYYSNSFLNDIAEIFECRGLEQARLFALSKLHDRDRGAARGILKVLDYIADCPAARDDAPVGRTIIKTLPSFKPAKNK